MASASGQFLAGRAKALRIRILILPLRYSTASGCISVSWYYAVHGYYYKFSKTLRSIYSCEIGVYLTRSLFRGPASGARQIGLIVKHGDPMVLTALVCRLSFAAVLCSWPVFSGSIELTNVKTFAVPFNSNTLSAFVLVGVPVPGGSGASAQARA